MRTRFDNASVLDVERGTLVPDRSFLVEDGRITETGASREVHGVADRTIDVRGRILMPGLIDCHVHVTAATANFAEIEEWSPFYLAARAGTILGGMLQRGFTTVRDAAGADFGLARAVQEGLVDGPRLIFGGRGLSQTGGHGDGRSSGRTAQEAGYSYTTGNVVCDGVPEVRRTVREEIKRGAQHIKLMLSGGVASPTDRVDSTQFSVDEIRAEVHSPTSILRAATVTAARLLRMEGQIGVVAPGAHADLLIVDANPLDDIGVLADPDTHVQLIMKAGEIYRDRLP